MNARSYLPHGLWALVAAGTFAAGFQFGRPAGLPGATTTTGSSPASSQGEQAKPWRSGTDAPAASQAPASSAPAAQAVGAMDTANLSADQMRATLAAILKEADPLKRNRLLAELMEKLTPGNIQAAIETFREGGMDPSNFRDMALLTYAWGKMDPAKALAYSETIDNRGKAFVTASILAGWTSKDPDAALAWFRDQKFTGFEKNIAARGMMEGLAQTDPQTATRLTLAETDKEVQGQFLDVIARQQIKSNGFGATREWIDGLLAAGSVDADLLSGAARDVADQWSKSDPKAATNWAISLPDSEAQRDALRPAIREWAAKDPTATSEYLTSLAASPVKDRAVQQFSETIAREDPKAALTWAASIEDPERRERTTIRAAQEWYQTDAEAATNWANSSNLSEDARKKISEEPDRGGWRGMGAARNRMR